MIYDNGESSPMLVQPNGYWSFFCEHKGEFKEWHYNNSAAPIHWADVLVAPSTLTWWEE